MLLAELGALALVGVLEPSEGARVEVHREAGSAPKVASRSARPDRARGCVLATPGCRAGSMWRRG